LLAHRIQHESGMAELASVSPRLDVKPGDFMSALVTETSKRLRQFEPARHRLSEVSASQLHF
jgi:hypothetical protein